MNAAVPKLETAIRAVLVPQLREDGFAGSGRTFRRAVNGCVQVVNVQGSRYGGRFAINLGLQPLAIPDVTGVFPDPRKISEPGCEFRRRLSSTGADQWWIHDSLAESMLAAPRDAIYGWTSERLVRKQTALGVSAYLYYFDHGYPASEAANLHAFHASEIPYVFGTADRTPAFWPKVPAEPAELQLSDAMMTYWSAFARTGTMQGANLPRWNAYATERAYMTFANVPQPGARLPPGMYELHEQVVCRRRVQGNISWNWNIGIVSPALPAEAKECQ